jgi:ribosome biogenesis GTPase A
MATPEIQWYPGHIAKAEKALADQLNRVDVVMEVRDARIPLATHYPAIDQWIGDKGRVLILNRVDMVTPEGRTIWQDWFKEQGDAVYFTDAKRGAGVATLARVAQAAGAAVNQRRLERGMKPRPVRAVVVGFPNVGKSALINRLLKRRVVESARRPGVTRQLRWVRVSGELDLLDAPGVIPARLDDQQAALKLAICDDIGEAAYDNQRVAAAFVDLLRELYAKGYGDRYGQALSDRYQIDPIDLSGESFIVQLAEQSFQQDSEKAARRLLNDYRVGNLGPLLLEWPPAT